MNTKPVQWEQAQWNQFSDGRLKQISHRDGGTPFKKGILLRGVQQAQPNNKPEKLLITTVWGVNSNNKAFEWRVDHWHEIPGDYYEVHCARNDNSVWGINTNNRLVKIMNKHGVYVGKIMSPEMYIISLAPLKNGHIAVIDKDQKIYIGSGNYWKQIDGQAIKISVGHDGTTWVVNKDHDIYRRETNKWVHVPGKLDVISVYDATTIVGINLSKQFIYMFVGERGNKDGWIQLDGTLIWISAGERTCMGCNAQNIIYGRSKDNILF
jgi:hypothetical protein